MSRRVAEVTSVSYRRIAPERQQVGRRVAFAGVAGGIRLDGSAQGGAGWRRGRHLTVAGDVQGPARRRMPKAGFHWYKDLIAAQDAAARPGHRTDG
ncbi:hypothetical protein [Streptomyces sp. NPDC014006]|uniref:hypothetical protein n=1 Tax=Streptomyces sp. NPDC014006 TaxID=3364870 RepID=UPI003702AD19